MRLLTVIMFLVFAGSSFGADYVRPYVRDGKVVGGYYRTEVNKTRVDNWSTEGNKNPWTGKKGYAPVMKPLYKPYVSPYKNKR